MPNEWAKRRLIASYGSSPAYKALTCFGWVAVAAGLVAIAVRTAPVDEFALALQVMALGSAAVLSYFWSTTEFWVDPAAELLVVRGSGLRRRSLSRSVPLSSVSAVLDRHFGGGRALEILLADGTSLPVAQSRSERSPVLDRMASEIARLLGKPLQFAARAVLADRFEIERAQTGERPRVRARADDARVNSEPAFERGMVLFLTSMRLRSAVLLGFLGLSACRSPAPSPAGSSASAAPSSPPTTSAPSAAPSAASRPAIARERVAAAVERWRSAQQQGDFTEYARLYARVFSGVKRAGAKTTHFDREGWMTDRRDMFRSDMRVELSKVEIFTGERSAFAVFVQDWSTSRYRDVGPKRLDFVETEGTLLISREEMLASKPAEIPGAKPPAPEELALLWPLRKGFGVVLRRGEVETRGTARRVPLSKEASDYYVEKDVAESVARSFAGLARREFALYDAHGLRCSAKASGLRAVGGYTWWESGVSADEVWKSLSDTYLVAVVEPADERCRPLWARAKDLQAPFVMTSSSLQGAEAEPALEALRRTAVAVRLQKSYLHYLAEGGKPEGGTPKTWEELAPSQFVAVAFDDHASAAKYAVVEREAGQGCVEFAGYALGFFKMAEPKWLDLTGNGDPSSELPARPFFGMRPLTAVRLPGGRLFMIGQDVVYADAGGGFVPIMAVGRQRTTCGC
jgi:hypothetical protein